MNISWIGAINNLGYGMASLHCVDELIKQGHDVALFPIGRVECHFRHEENIKRALKNAETFDVDADCIRIWHQHDMSMFVGKGKHIGFPIFELDTFTDKEKHHLRSCDAVWTCSDWGREILYQIQPSIHDHDYHIVNKSTQLRTVPLGVDHSVFAPKMSGRKSTIFLNVGKWEIRKGHDILIEAFNKAFTTNDNVELWMMCDNPFLTPEQTGGWQKLYKLSPIGDKVRFIPRVESDVQVAEIMQQADCGIFPSRAEGWNLEALEMLSCGKQVIATDYSAHTEFLTKENAWLVSINDIEPAYDGIWFHKQGNWGKITNESMEDLIQHMRYIHGVKQRGDLELNRKGIETAKTFSWYNTAHTIVSLLE